MLAMESKCPCQLCTAVMRFGPDVAMGGPKSDDSNSTMNSPRSLDEVGALNLGDDGLCELGDFGLPPAAVSIVVDLC